MKESPQKSDLDPQEALLEIQKDKEDVLIEELSPEDAEDIFSQTEIHGEKFNGEELTLEKIRENNLLPHYKITIGEKTLWFSSNPYNLGEGRIAIVAYVENEGMVVARSYYRSNSQGVWRYLPNYVSHGKKIDWYSKGYGQSSITLPALTQQALAHITRDKEKIVTINNPDLFFAGTARPLNQGGTYLVEIQPKAAKIGDFLGAYGDKIAPEKIKLPENTSPNLDKAKVIAKWAQDTELYGKIHIEVLPSMDDKFQFIFCRDELNRVWLGGIENHSKIQSTGLRKIWVNGDDLTTPAYEYRSEAGTYGNPLIQSGDYIDMFTNYLSQIPVIRDYCESRSISLPPLINSIKERGTLIKKPKKKTEAVENPETETLIQDAESFDELFKTLKKLGGITSRGHYYTFEELKDLIDKVRSGTKDTDYITRVGGLRKKVRELLEEE